MRRVFKRPRHVPEVHCMRRKIYTNFHTIACKERDVPIIDRSGITNEPYEYLKRISWIRLSRGEHFREALLAEIRCFVNERVAETQGRKHIFQWTLLCFNENLIWHIFIYVEG